MGLLHLVQRHVDSVQQRRAPLGLGERQAILDILQVGCEVLNQLRAVVELYQEELVFGVGGLEKVRNRLAGFRELVPHAAAGVEDEADGKRRILAGEVRNLLLHLVLKQPEVLFFQAGYEAVERVGDGHIDQNDGCVDANVGSRTFRFRSRGLGSRIDRDLGAIRTPGD